MWRRRHKRDVVSEATRALAQAQRDLVQREAETPRVEALTRRWREIRERNNLASAFEASMRGRHS